MIDITTSDLSGNSNQNIFNKPKRRKIRMVLDRLGWAVVLLLLIVGLISLFNRVELLNSEFSKDVVNIGNGVSNFDIRYIQHYFIAGVHLLFGLIVYVFAPFSS